MIKKLWMRITGQQRIEDCKFFCQEIQDSRKLISALNSRISAMELRLWTLERHSPEATLERAADKVAEYIRRTEELIG